MHRIFNRLAGVLAALGLVIGFAMLASPADARVVVGVGIGAPWGYPYPYYPYPYPYYHPYYYAPPPVVVAPPAPVYVSPPPAPTVAPQAQTWYYCDNPQGYYPYVNSCNAGWRQVPAQPTR